MRVRQLVERHPARWFGATHHPFLDGVRDGTLPNAAFDRWLEQDRLFVETLARAWALIVANAPASDLSLLADGISAYVGEMAWFEVVAIARALIVPAEPRLSTAEYQAHLLRLAGEPYPVALAGMWAVEAAYLEGWRTALPGATPYRPFVEHWTDHAFAAFVDRLEAAADRELEAASPEQVDAASGEIFRTAGHEAAFWNMSWTSEEDGTLD